MSRNPRNFRKASRLIVSVEAEAVRAIDALMKVGRHHRHQNRSEFVRQAIEREMQRCQSDDFETSTRVSELHPLGKL